VKIVFFGTPEFAVPSLEALHGAGHDIALVVAQPDRPSGRGMKMQAPAVAVRARELRLPLLQPEKIRTEEFLESMRGVSPEAAVVIAYGRILPQSLLRIPRHGFINVHGSILPKYRGAAPIQRAIEAGEEETGVSIMQLDPEMDHGPVFAIERTAIRPDERTPELAARLARIGAQSLATVLEGIAAGSAHAEEQDHAAATHAPKIEKEEGLVDWSLPARRIYDRFRAFWPWPGTFTHFRGEPVKLVAIRREDQRGAAGVVLDASEALIVGAGEGSIRVTELQRPGKRAVPAVEFIRALSVRAGERVS
jgi:methionyl-tRNA formyltransferase